VKLAQVLGSPFFVLELLCFWKYFLFVVVAHLAISDMEHEAWGFAFSAFDLLDFDWSYRNGFRDSFVWFS